MKTTMNGIVYDTTKAKYIDGYTVKSSFSERFEIMEYLYRTPTGEYFTGRFGGACTDCAEGVLTPLSADELKIWCETHMKPQDIARLVPELKQAPVTHNGIQITLNITPESIAQLLTLAASYAPALCSAFGEVVRKGVYSGD